MRSDDRGASVGVWRSEGEVSIATTERGTGVEVWAKKRGRLQGGRGSTHQCPPLNTAGALTFITIRGKTVQ